MIRSQQSRYTSVAHLDYMSPHSGQEWVNVGLGLGIHQLPVVEPEAYPKVVHEHRESEDNTGDTPGSTELVVFMLVEAAVSRFASVGYDDFFRRGGFVGHDGQD
jgi:hypothetical protein